MSVVDFLLRRVMGQLLNRGVKIGLDKLAGGGRARPAAQAGAAPDDAAPGPKMTPEERQARRQAREARQIARRARQAAKLSRKLMR